MPEPTKTKPPMPKPTTSKPAKSRPPKPAPLTRSEVMARIKSRDTKPEMIVRRALWASGYRYRLHDKRLPGRPDLSLPGIKTAIFVHGCFWHAHEGCPAFRPPKSRLDFWEAKLARNKSRDLEVRSRLEAGGWRVLTVWECQLEKPNWLEGLLALLDERKGPGAALAAERGAGKPKKARVGLKPRQVRPPAPEDPA
jgi:DNA mismatch endonuclease (patch repair protein)